VTIGENSAEDVADEAGQWMVRLEKMSAGGPHTMVVTGEETITFKDVLVGDVWLCSGQSNMQWPLNNCESAEQAVPAANYPKIRHYGIKRESSHEPQPTTEGTWRVCKPGDARWFSAVAYFFGRDLHRELDVPIGLIHASVGASSVEAWTSRSALEKLPQAKALLASYDAAMGRPPAERQIDPRRQPAMLYNQMIHPVIPYAIRGAIWYQGEHNTGNAYDYRMLLPGMIEDWRTRWGQDDFPFLIVQLPNYGSPTENPADSKWAVMRESQLVAAKQTKNAGLATTIDIGEARNIHPGNKRDVGARLARVALALEYGRDIVPTGPIVKDADVDGQAIRLSFENVGKGLVAKGGEGLAEFVIAGEDRKFVPAEAKIDGEQVVVSSPAVAKPIAVRYAWASNPENANLYNKAGLPASPFRTDNWPVITQPREKTVVNP
jgi:sialate O-acetylesterase